MNTDIEKHYRSYYTKLVKRVSYRLGNKYFLAEEVVQEAYTRALKYYKSFDPSYGEFDQWFSLILNNATRACQNQEKHRGIAGDTLVFPNTDEQYFRNGLEKSIGLEESRNATILSLYFLDGWRTPEISNLLNCNHNTVRQIINRYRERVVAEPKGMA